MFGIIHALFTGGVLAADGISRTWNNAGLREQARLKGDLTYYDTKNQERLVANDRLVFNGMVNGDEVIKDFENGKIYANLSQKKREKQRKEDIERAKSKDSTVINCLGEERFKYEKEDWYDSTLMFNEDIETRHPIYPVNINNKWFLMDLTNGKILREGHHEECYWAIKYVVLCQESQIKCDNLTTDQIIKIFNNRQQNIDKLKIKESIINYFLHSYYYLQGRKAFIINGEVKISSDEYGNDLANQEEWYDVKGE